MTTTNSVSPKKASLASPDGLHWLRLVGGQVPNVIVLGLLGGLLFWGHAYQWHVPTLSQMMRGSAEPELQVSPDDALPGAADLPVKEAKSQIPLLEPISFESPEAIARSGIELATVERRPMVDQVTCLGSVTYDQTRLAQLCARVSGTVWSVEKKVGETIKKGELLAIIEALDIGRAKSEFLQAVVAAELREGTYRRLRQSQSTVPYRSLREAEAKAREARIELFNAQQTLVNLGLPVKLEDVAGLHDEELVKRVHFLGLPKSLVDRLDPQKTTANLVPLVAPFDGTVIGREIVVGELVEPSSTGQFVMADVRRMWIELDVSKEDAGKIRLGQGVVFSTEGVVQEIRAALSWISTEVDKRTRMVQARIEVDNPLIHGESDAANGQRLLRANMFGVGQILIQEKPDALVVPNQSIQRDGPVNVVFLRADECVFQPKQIELGIVGDSYTEVLTGLKPGDQIAAAGSHVLKSEILKQRLAGSGS